MFSLEGIDMKIKKLGIEWGAAYQEAQPISISHDEQEIFVFITDRGDIQIDMCNDFECVWTASRLSIKLKN
jgi:hypothetical protein